jgi:hypothetical protein
MSTTSNTSSAILGEFINILTDYEPALSKDIQNYSSIVEASSKDSPGFRKDQKGVILYIPKGTTELDDGAFEGCKGVSKVFFPSSLIKIGVRTFEGCTGITDLQFSDDSNLVEIRASAFQRCTKLRNLLLSGTKLTEIGDSAFMNCRKLTDIEFPPTLVTIEKYAFLRCIKLSVLRFPDSLTAIKYRAFDECTGLEEIHLPGSITAIENHAFGEGSYYSRFPPGVRVFPFYARLMWAFAP